MDFHKYYTGLWGGMTAAIIPMENNNYITSIYTPSKTPDVFNDNAFIYFYTAATALDS